MMVLICGNRIHFTTSHAIKLLKIVILFFVALILVTLVLRYRPVPYEINVYEQDESNKLKTDEENYDFPIFSDFISSTNNVNSEIDFNPEDQDLLDYISSHLKIFIQPIANEGGRFFYNVRFTNNGNKPIPGCCWSIYMYSSKMLDILSMNRNFQILTSVETNSMFRFEKKKDVSFGEEKYQGVGRYRYHAIQSFIVSHVMGYTFKMKPTNKFKPIEPHDTRIVRFIGNGWAVSRSEFIPNWYVANDHNLALKPRLLMSTVGESLSFVDQFKTKSSKIRFEDDLFRPITPDERFQQNIMKKKHQPRTLIPTPILIKSEGSMVVLGSHWRILYGLGFENEANRLHEKLLLKTPPLLLNSSEISLYDSIVLRPSDDETQAKMSYIINNRNEKLRTKFDYHMDSAYILEAKGHMIQIWSSSSEGMFYGVISLINLIMSTMLGEGKMNQWSVLPYFIVDAPRFKHRGVMIDVSRNFFSIADLTKIIEVMTLYKLNVLHLHLSDDEGWRLEIPGLPELTKVGGRRGHDLKEESMVMSLLGSDQDSKTGSGHYSVEEFRDLLRFASARHVKVIPEFDMPSHSHAAIVSMKARHRASPNKSRDFLLSDLRDTSFYSTGQFYYSSAINPCIKSTYRFVHHILRQLVKIYKGVAPLNYFHLGGDEVPQNAYQESPACHMLLLNMKKKEQSFFGNGPKVNLKAFFIENVARLAAKLNLSLIGWDDAFLKEDGTFMSFDNSDVKTDRINNNNNNDDNDDDDDNNNIYNNNNSNNNILFIDDHINISNNSSNINNNKHSNNHHDELDGNPNKEVVVQYYYNTWEHGLASKPYIMANKGMKVILSPITAMYLDSPQEPDPEDWGLHWASRYTNTRHTFFFTPGNIYNSIDYTFEGKTTNKTFVCSKHNCPPLLKPENILGMEAVMWSELIRTPDRMHSMLFPRLIAVAERSWHQALWENQDPSDPKTINRKQKNWEQFATTVGRFELKKLEEYGISYYLSRPGINASMSLNSMFPGLRINVSDDSGLTWRKFNETEKFGKKVFMFATVSFDGKRRSTPVIIDRTK